MAQRLGTSVTETAGLVGCSRSAFVSTHAKWINDGDTGSRRQGVVRPCVIKEKGCRGLSRLWAREHRDWTMEEWKRVAWLEESRFLIHHVDGRARVRRLSGEQLLLSCTVRSCTDWWWQYYALGDVLMGGSGTRSCGRTDHESCELSDHRCGSVASLHGVCLPHWKLSFPAGQRPMSQGSHCVGVVRGAYG
ncbi:hypothetical protein AVEN_177871-1 [Araneus ventricosus]|uniref:Transposase Tc1-like domain-containing protein n=1 Tax=Araneus ventricosus TaxID=182803 RepID=A0A4Y2N2A5_ARAVE|nr:hypothetical protein AVEN_177871-1 [Araneus ventricosus]